MHLTGVREKKTWGFVTCPAQVCFENLPAPLRILLFYLKMVKISSFINPQRSITYFHSQDISALSNFESDFDEIDWINSIFKDVPKNEKEVSSVDFVPRKQQFNYN